MQSEPIKDLAAGATKGALEWTEERINELAFRFKNRDLIFVEDNATIKEAIAERRSAEWKTYSKYVTNKDLRVLIQLGLTLRKLEGTPKLQELRDRIVKKYRTWGLHVAEFVQNKAIGTVVMELLPRRTNTDEVVRDIEQLLMDIDKYVLFVKDGTIPEKAVSELNMRMIANRPPIVVILGSGYAKRTTQLIWRGLKRKAVEYEAIEVNDEHKYIGAFFLEEP